MSRTILALLFAAASLTAAPPPLTPMDEFQYELAADPQISPDGARIVYVRQFADVMTDRRLSNLWIVNFDGTGHRPLTTGNFSDASPRWSPDGSSIAFLSDRDGARQIWRLWLDNGQLARLTSLQNAPSGLSWSPDGKSIAFTALVPSSPPGVVTMPKPPEGAKWAEPARVINSLVYRFNAAGYLKPGYVHIFTVPAEGGTPAQISSGNHQHGGPAARASEPVWTPDSRFLLMGVNRRDDSDRESLDSDIHEFNVADRSVRKLTSRFGPDSSPMPSPDGKLIAYTGFDDTRQGYTVTRLYVMNRDGSGSRLVSASWDRDVTNLRWSPDGANVYFASVDQGTTGLYAIGLTGGQPRLVAKGLGSGVSAYSRGGDYTVAKNGNFAMTTCTASRPGDIAAGNVARTGTRTLTSVNEDLFSQRSLGQVEEIWYESSKDKRKVHGWIIKPPDFDPAKKYPLILEIHGGPFASYGPNFDLEKQMMAANGYVVLYTNPRGSTSYGQEFGNLIHHAYPGDDFYDLDAGVTAVVAKGYIDPKRLYVTGGSGGGVLTCWLIGRSDRFRAAVTVYPVINWYSFTLTSDIGNFTSKNWFPGLPWDHVEHYEKRSLLSVVKNVKTPTMVLTGEEDWRTPMSESEQYYQALKLLGVESMLVRVPGEPHGISVRPSHHIAKMLHIIEWFNKHP
jgi:acylaminoacyl-peptidase